MAVSCGIAAYQTAFEDTDLETFNTNLKVKPPFRNSKDNSALIKGLQEGTIEVITSSHKPEDEEGKKLEFDLAEFGITSLQTVAHNLSVLSDKVDWEVLIQAVTAAPRNLLGLEVPKFEEDVPANLTLLDLHKEWILNSATNRSKSENSPYWNTKIKGQVVATFGNGQHYIAP